jgi:tetratricopeptide (TPR) repeat protein
LSEQQRKDYAAKLKAAGNKAYGSKDYSRAIDLYGQAILCKADAVFYSNRAACWNAMSNWSKVIDDTTAAITIDPEYIKALNRRANAYEQEARYSEALLDYTASCIIDQFRNDASPTFVSNYLQSFRDNGLPEGLEETADLPEGSGKALLRKGLKAIKLRTGEGYTEAADSFEKAIEAGGLDKNEALAYNMRGTFRYLRGDGDSALSDLNKSLELDPALVQSYVKRASMHLEQSTCGTKTYLSFPLLTVYPQLNVTRLLVTLSLPLSTTPKTLTSSTTAPSSTSSSPSSPWLPPTTRSQSTSTLNSSSLTFSSVSHNTRWDLSPLPWLPSAVASRTSATRAMFTTTTVSSCSTSRSTRRPLRSSRPPLRWRRRSLARRAEE